MTIADGEVSALLDKYDLLEYDNSSRVVSGELIFNACWLPDDEELLIGLHPSDSHRLSHNYIADKFEIKIELGRLKEEGYPAVTLQGNKINRILARLKVIPEDIHLTRQGAHWDCCLLLGEPSAGKLPLLEFVDRFIIPFLYRLSYANSHGLAATRRDLWPEYSHGVAGLEEWLDEHPRDNLFTRIRIAAQVKAKREFDNRINSLLEQIEGQHQRG